MLSHDLLVILAIQRTNLSLNTACQQLYFQSDLALQRSWFIDGRNYSRTLEAWLRKQDKNAKLGMADLCRDAEARGLGKDEATKTFNRFRVFYMACSELFAFNKGQE